VLAASVTFFGVFADMDRDDNKLSSTQVLMSWKAGTVPTYDLLDEKEVVP
jgi:hypothetical protein